MTQTQVEPQTPTGIEFARSLMTDSQPGRVRRRPIPEWIAAIEQEARAEATAPDAGLRAALEEASEHLIIAFRRWYFTKHGAPPTEDDFRAILRDATVLAAHPADHHLVDAVLGDER